MMLKLIDCNSQLELAYWELFYIREFNTLTPNGFNESINTSARLKPGSRAKGVQVRGIKHSSENRQKHSLEIIAVNPELKLFYLCDSAALFGENVVNTHRAHISNACKSKTRYKGGWYFYYRYMLPFSFTTSTMMGYGAALASGLLTGRGNYQFKKIAEALFMNSHAFLRSEGYELYELRYADNDDRFTLEKRELPEES